MTKLKLSHIAIIITLLFWPLNLFLVNTTHNFIAYSIPPALLILSYILYKKDFEFYLLPIFLVPFFEPKLAVLPLLFSLINLILEKKRRKYLFFTIFAIIILASKWSSFAGQTVFTSDYEARQAIIRKTHLYSSVFIARTFHNKARIPVDKILYNFFAMSDPNNYFFGFHPHEIKVDNQNLNKFPFLSILLVFFGIYYLPNLKSRKFVISAFLSSIIALSILTIFDRNDFVLWVPISLILIHGSKEFEKRFKKKANIFFLILVACSVLQLIRSFILIYQ